MKSHSYDGKRMDVTATRPFVEVVAAFEQRVPSQDLKDITELISRRASRHDIEVQKMVGDLGFMLLTKLDAGPLVSF